MSLKGYQWLNDDGKSIMGYFFKDETIYLWDDVTEIQYNDFINYIEENGCKHQQTKMNGHEIRSIWFNRGE